jgi:hypothetical protein
MGEIWGSGGRHADGDDRKRGKTLGRAGCVGGRRQLRPRDLLWWATTEKGAAEGDDSGSGASAIAGTMRSFHGGDLGNIAV